MERITIISGDRYYSEWLDFSRLCCSNRILQVKCGICVVSWQVHGYYKLFGCSQYNNKTHQIVLEIGEKSSEVICSCDDWLWSGISIAIGFKQWFFKKHGRDDLNSIFKLLWNVDLAYSMLPRYTVQGLYLFLSVQEM